MLVLAALALIAFVAGEFAGRIDRMREQSQSLDAYSHARVDAASAKALVLYRLASMSGGPDAFMLGAARLKVDGRPYLLASDSMVSVQDARATFSLNMVRRDRLDRLLESFGVNPARRDALADVLLDYTDTDKLRRLNGAEEADYRALGLEPPRNDWLRDARELRRMALWRDERELVDALLGLVSVRRADIINPNVAPLAVLRAYLPNARDDQLALFDTLRRAMPFSSGAAGQSATGLALDSDGFFFYTSSEQIVRVVAPGFPRAFQYSIRLTPGGAAGPWQINDFHLTDVPRAFHVDAPAAFPLPVEGAEP